MGKKKSAALIVLITIVLVGLLFLSITPTFPVTSPNSFRSLLSIVDLGRDLDGGYYTVYYPEGVISKAEYETVRDTLTGLGGLSSEGERKNTETKRRKLEEYGKRAMEKYTKLGKPSVKLGFLAGLLISVLCW